MKKKLLIGAVILVITVIGMMFIKSWQLDKMYKSQSLTEFMNILQSEDVEKIEYVHNYESEATLRYKIGDEYYAVRYPSLYLSFNPTILDLLAEHGVEVSFKTNPMNIGKSIVSGLFSAIFLILILVFLRYMVSMVSEDIYVSKSTNVDTTFDDIAGYERLKEELKEYVDMLRNPQSYKKYGVHIPKGLLLTGPPGNGKTLCARAIAGESGTPFFHISASRIENKFVGSGSRRLEKVLNDVKKQSKIHGRAILFIDEIDAIGVAREKRTVVETNQTLNTLLTAMDGFDKDDHILFIAATNMADKLDSALVRAGRFDKTINVPQPDFKDRKAIFRMYLDRRKDVLDPKVMEEDFINFLAVRTNGKCAADIRQIVNDACSLAHRYKKDIVDAECLREAIIRSTVGIETDYKPSEDELRIIAYHEAGHATVRCLLHPEGAKSVAYITVKSYNKALGHVAPIDGDSVLWRKSHIENQVKMLLGGRIVEEKMLDGDYTTGAADDLRQINRILFAYVTKYGMAEDAKNLFAENVGEDDERVQESVAKIRNKMYEETKSLIHDNFELVERIAVYLIEHRFMDQETLVQIVDEYKKEKLSV